MAVAAEFIADHVLGTVPLRVQFTDLSTGSPDTWLWSFGATTYFTWEDTVGVDWEDTESVVWLDTSFGAVSAEQHPEWVFDSIGVYTVSLTASLAGDSDTETKVDYIIVIAAAIARPILLHSGIVEAYFPDGWENDKHWFVSQGDNAYPCSIQFVDIYCNTTND